MTNDPFQVGVVQEINRFTNAQRGHELIDRYAVRGTEGNYTSVRRPDWHTPLLLVEAAFTSLVTRALKTLDARRI